MLFGKNDGILSGLSVDSSKNIYIADAGNKRLLKVNAAGAVEVVYRGDDPYFPNGITTTPAGDFYVLEVGFKPPSTWLPARVRKITSSGQSSIVAVSGEITKVAMGIGPPRYGYATFRKRSIPLYLVSLIGAAIVGIAFGAWQLSRKLRR